MSVVSIIVPSIGFPPAAGASKLIDLTDVEAGAAGSKIGQFLTELAPVSGARRFGFMAAAGGLKVADWDVGGAVLPLPDQIGVGASLSTLDGILTATATTPILPDSGSSSTQKWYGMTIPFSKPTASALLQLIWPIYLDPDNFVSSVFGIIHDVLTDVTQLPANISDSIPDFASGFAYFNAGDFITFPQPNIANLLPLPIGGSSDFEIVINSDMSAIYKISDQAVGASPSIQIDNPAITIFYAVPDDYSEDLPVISVDISATTLSGGVDDGNLPPNISDLDTIYRVNSGGSYGGYQLLEDDFVIFYDNYQKMIVNRPPAKVN